MAVNLRKDGIDIGPRKIDLYRYLKTDLYYNWHYRCIPTLFIHQNWSKTAISRHPNIKYRNARIAKVVDKLKSLKTNEEYPEDMVSRLFNFINKKHLKREKCNQWIIEKMQQWLWKENRKYSIKKMTQRLHMLAQRENLQYRSISCTKVQSFMKRFLGFSYKNKVRVPDKKTTKSHHRLRTT